MTRELKWYIEKYLFNTKEGNKIGIEEQKGMAYRKDSKKADVNPSYIK